MEFMLLIYENEAARGKATEAEMGAMFAAYETYSKNLVEKGAMRGGNAVQPSSTATAVRLRNGKTQTTDGPAAETAEQLAGYYLIDCKDLDEALDWAAQVPSAAYGTIEVRPVMNFD